MAEDELADAKTNLGPGSLSVSSNPLPIPAVKLALSAVPRGDGNGRSEGDAARKGRIP
jgi:hypothetical protein